MIKYFLTDEAVINGCRFASPREGDAGYDLYANSKHRIISATMQLVSTGLSIQLPEGHVGIIKSRSSLGGAGIDILGGVIDESYRGEIKILMYNHSNTCFDIDPGDRVAQLLVLPCYTGNTHTVITPDKLDSSLRGTGGFGSTGK